MLGGMRLLVISGFLATVCFGQTHVPASNYTLRGEKEPRAWDLFESVAPPSGRTYPQCKGPCDETAKREK
jgi:hypothetical protein